MHLRTFVDTLSIMLEEATVGIAWSESKNDITTA